MQPEWESIFEAIGQPALVLDPQHRIIAANRATSKAVGKTEEELLGKKCYEVFHGADEPAEGCPLEKMISSGHLETLEMEMETLHGTFLVSCTPLFDDAGKLFQILHIATDITERKQVERALQRSEEKAKQLAQENAVIAEIGRIINSTLNIEEVYKAFAEKVRELIGFDRIAIGLINVEQNTVSFPYIEGISVPARQPRDVIPLAGTVAEKMLQTRAGITFRMENEEEISVTVPGLLPEFRCGIRSALTVPLISRDRVIGTLSFRSTIPGAYTDRELGVAENIGNQIAGAIANARLFSELKGMEGALRKSEERFRDLYDHAPVGYHEFDSEGRITHVNRTDLEMLGYTAEEIIGQHVWELNVEPEEVRERVLAKLAGTLPPDRNLELTYRRKDGTTFPVLIEGRLVLDEQGRIKGIRSTIQDITERKRAEAERTYLSEQLHQSQKMEAIGTLAGGIAHDFNNILSAILGYAELASLELKEDSKANYYLEHSMTAARRAKDLVQQILAFSRQGREERKLLNIRPIIIEGLKFLRAALPATIEIQPNVEEDLGAIEADPTQVHQVLMNLCTNAAHAMEEKGGVLEVSLCNMEMGETSAITAGIVPGPYVRLRVRDTGHGMPPDVLKRIFDPYFTTKGIGKGTGLGLAVVQGIVKGYGGGIIVSSEVGKGSTLDIYFPRVEAADLPSGGVQA